MSVKARAHASRRYVLPVVAGLAVSGWLGPGAPHAQEEIRIAIARSPGPVPLSGSDLRAEDIVTADVLVTGQRVILLGVDEQGVTVAGQPTRAHRVIVTGRDGVSYQGRTFRGRVEVLWQKVGGRVQVLLVHPLPIENYLVGILTGELPKDWPMEAMKAQAVAARTYAVYQKYNAPDRPYHLESTVLDQVYGGAQHERPGSRAAVAATAGEVLTYRRRPIRAFFHSCCAGRTESALEGWGSAEPYLPGSTCGFCGDCGRASWQLRVPLAKLTQALDDKRLSVGQVREVRVSKLSATERVLELQVEGAARTRALHSEDLRRILGYDQLRSRLFKVRKDGTDVVFSGKGSGHGVGMCQWGARGMALNSFSYRAILDRYYPGAKLQQMY